MATRDGTHLTVRMTYGEKAQLARAAAQRGVTVASLVRGALAQQGVHLEGNASRNTSGA